MKPFFSLQNIINPQQLQYLSSLGDNLQGDFHKKNYTDRGQSLGSSTERDMPEDIMNEVYGMVKDKLEKETGTMYPTYGVFSNSMMPMGEHVDVDPTHKDFDKSPAYSILVPLTSGLIASTVVWNAVKKDLSKDLTNNIDVLEDPNYSYSDKEQEVVSHCTLMQSNTVGKPYVFENITGSVVCWNRSYIHASGNNQNYDYLLDTRTMKPRLNVLDNGDGSFKTANRVVKKFILILTRWGS